AKHVNTASSKVNTARPKTVLNVVQGNQGNPQQDLKDKGVIDSGFSMHMIENISYLTDYEEIEFQKRENYVSQMCDKKNSVLFTDTACVVLSPDFKLTDESHVLLKVPRKDNMYSVDLKNVVPQGGLTCLFAKATSDESTLWHRRLGYTQNPLFSSSSKDSPGDGSKPSGKEEKKDVKDPENKDNEVPSTEEPRVNQKKDANVNSTNNINTVSPTDNVAGIEDKVVNENIVYECADDPNMPELEDISIFEDPSEDIFGAEADLNNLESTFQVSLILTTRIHKDHPLKQVIRDLHSAPQTRRMTKSETEHETKKDERGIVIKNKARLVTQGYTQEEGIDYDEVFAPISRIKAIRLFLDYASFKDFVVYQMDVKSAFLYGQIEEKVYVCQPSGFKDPDFPDKVYKVEKALYGLHQTPRAWYETLSTYLLENGFQRGKIDKTLFIKSGKSDILLVQVYVDDIIFGSTRKELCNEFEKIMHKNFKMSSMGELTFFLGLQVKQKEDEIFISQDKYVNEILNKFDFSDVTTANTPMETKKPLLKDEDGVEVDATAKAKNINGEARIRAKVDGKNFLISEATIRRDLKFEYKGGVDCLSNEVIFEQLPLMGFAQVFLDKQVDELSKHKAIYVIPSHTKKVFSNMRRVGKDFSRKVTPLFLTMLVPAREEELGEGSTMPSALQHTPIIQPSISKPQKKQKSRNPMRHDTKETHPSGLGENVADEALNAEHIPTHSNDPLLSGEGSIQLNLKRRVKKLEKKQGSRAHKLKRLYKVSLSAKIESFDEEQSLGEEDASKQERNIADIDVDAEITLVDETTKDQGSTTAPITTTDVTPDELTMAQALVEIKKSKPKGDNTRPKARGVVMQEPSETTTTTIPIPLKFQDKGKGIMVKEPLKMKKKDQISFDHQEAIRLQAEIDKEERLAGERARLVDDDQEAAELKRCLEIVPDDGNEVTIDATQLSSKSPTIVDYKIHKEGRKSYFQIIKADGNSQMYLTLSKMLKNFNREDLEVLWGIVKARFEKNIVYYLLVEKMYPLRRNTLHQMWNDVKLQVDYELEMAYDLLRLDSLVYKGGPRSTRTRHAPDRMCLYIDTEDRELRDLGEPANYKAAWLNPKSNKWLNAMNVKMQSTKENEVWDLVKLPPKDKTVGSKWLFKKKTDMDGAVHTYKARLVTNGYTQSLGIAYEETFSPIADIRAIRILIAIAAFYYYEIWQMDVKTAFLNGYLCEEIYMKQPEGFVNPKYPNRVCKLKRSINMLKQASRQWNKRFDDEIKKFCFTQNRDEPCVYLKSSGSYITFLILYVDDILIMGNNILMLQDVKSYLGRYHMENSKRESIPMQDKLRLSKSQGASTPAELKRMQNVPYASAVGSIIYAVRCTRPDVAFAQNIISRFQQNPELRVSCYTDAGYLTDADDLKSQTKYVFVLNEGAVDWKSAKQSIFATSFAEAGYIAAFDASKEAVWVRKLISGLGVVPTIEEPISMYCDNTGAITIANESGVTKRARHFHAKVHYLREVMKYGDVKLEKFHTYDNLADPFTKALAFLKHSEHTKNIGMLLASSLM
nr:ribonuclease H-like domain-containing protein [Tanacetum cinerariifolium]